MPKHRDELKNLSDEPPPYTLEELFQAACIYQDPTRASDGEEYVWAGLVVAHAFGQEWERVRELLQREASRELARRALRYLSRLQLARACSGDRPVDTQDLKEVFGKLSRILESFRGSNEPGIGTLPAADFGLGRSNDPFDEAPIADALTKIMKKYALSPEELEELRWFVQLVRLERAQAARQGLTGNAANQKRPPKQSQPKGRMKREVAHPLITEHLTKRPHDTAQQVADAVGCSVGVVSESPAWQLNQRRLRIAKQQGIDPKAVELNEKAINAAGGDGMTQSHDHRRWTDAMDDELDQREQELFQRIGEYQKGHPDASQQQVASAVGCTAGDVERRQAMLDRLATEQAESEKEDIDVEDPATKRGKRRKWVEKQV